MAKGITLAFGLLLLVIAALQLQWFIINPWMSIRLAPAFELARGNPIYPTGVSGPYVSTLYGFIGPWFYVPWTWISNADWALRAAGIWTVLWTVGIGVYVTRRELRRPIDDIQLTPPARAFLLALFVLGIWAMPSLRYCLLEIHADGPALVLIVIACLAALRYHETSRARWLVLLSAAAGTAPWAKQIAVFPLLGVFLWLISTRGWKPALLAGLGTIVIGLVWAGIGSIAHGIDTLWFNLVTIPGNQPWVVETARGARIDVVSWEGKFIALRELVTQKLPWDYGPLALLLLGLAGALRKWGGSNQGAFLRAQPAFTIFAITALCGIPALVLGLVKVGGELNSAGYVTYPAWIALIIGTARMVPALRDNGIDKPAALAGFLSIAGLSIAPIPERARLLEKPSHQALQTFLESNPRTIYCPSDPLVHILAENFCPPIGDIILSMKLGGHKVTREQFAKAYPGGPNFRYIAYPYFNSGEAYIAELFSSFTETGSIESLPGIRVIRQPGPASSWNSTITR